MIKKILITFFVGTLIGWLIAYKFMPPRDSVLSIPCISADLQQNGEAITPPGFGKGKWIYCEEEFFKYRKPQYNEKSI